MSIILSQNCCDCDDVYNDDLGPCDECGCPTPWQATLTLTYKLWIPATGTIFNACLDNFGTAFDFSPKYNGEATFTRQANPWIYLATAKKERQWFNCFYFLNPTNTTGYYTNHPTPTLVFDSATTTWTLNLNSFVSSGIGNIEWIDCDPGSIVGAIYTANNQGIGPNTTDLITFDLQ